MPRKTLAPLTVKLQPPSEHDEIKEVNEAELKETQDALSRGPASSGQFENHHPGGARGTKPSGAWRPINTAAAAAKKDGRRTAS